MRSLQTRLSTGLIIILVVLLGLVLAVGGYSLHHLAEDFVATRLEHDMDALLAALSFDESARPRLRQDRLNSIFRQPYSGHYYKLRSGDFQLRSRSLWDTDLVIPATTRYAVTRYFTRGPEGQHLLVLARSFEVQDREVMIAVTEDFTALAAGLHQMMVRFIMISLLLLAALVLIQRVIVRQGLKPLEETRRDILRLAGGEVRQLNEAVPLEVHPLVREINHLIAIMERRLQRSRHALGNLAHALKTPLTVLTQLAEHPRVKQQGDLYGELGHQTRQIRLLMERELKRARIAGAATPGQRIVLAEEIADLTDTLKKIYRDKLLAIESRIPPDSLFPGDRDDLLELLGNLLDNACKWASGKVRLTVEEKTGWLWLIIEDDGPGCPPSQLALLTQRGVRIDESRSGHGLGLAIVTDIVEQYGGHMSLDRSSALGGLQVLVEVPQYRSAGD